MSILFRCPCGRSMVVESDKAGAVVMCPNCQRRLRVPSGKGRGVEIPAALATAPRTSRRCPGCGKDVPVDSQICPHCQTVLTEEGRAKAAQAAAPAPFPPVRKRKAVKRPTGARAPIAAPASGLVYGGARGGWFSRLSSTGKTGLLIGGFVFLIFLVVLMVVVGLSGRSSRLHQTRDTCRQNLADGRALETRGEFQKAYDLYTVPMSVLGALKNSGEPGDAQLASQLKRRARALQYLVSRPKIRGSVYWKPETPAEYDKAMAYLRQHYGEYRQLCLRVADAGLAAVQAGKEDAGRAAFQKKVADTMEAYTHFIDQTTKQQQAQITFQQLCRALTELGEANQHYASPDKREMHLANAEQYFLALKERVSQSGYPDAILQR